MGSLVALGRKRAVSFRRLLSHPNSVRLLGFCSLAESVTARYIGNLTPRVGHPSDLSDERWELIEPVLTAWWARRRRDALNIGRPPVHDLRQIMNAILYVDRTGVPWHYLPHDFAPRPTIYGYFAKWQQDGVFEQLTGPLRRLVREAEGHGAEPSACVLDSQVVKTSATCISPTRAPTPANGSSAASATWAATRSACC